MRQPLLVRTAALLLGLGATVAACSDSPTEPSPRTGVHRDIGVGELVQLNVNAKPGEACSNPAYRTGRVVAKSTRAVVIADTANPADGLTDAEYRGIARDFDELVYPVVTQAFGTPSDIDGNERVVIFYTRAVNELTPAGQGWYTGGFFHPRDLFPQRPKGGLVCSTSNATELLYMLVPDPAGAVHGNVRGRDLVLRTTIGVLGHELQHLINTSGRLFRAGGAVVYEQAWLDEGLSHIAEELLGHHAGNTAPRQNLDRDRVRAEPTRTAFNQYLVSNFGRLQSYLERPDTALILAPGPEGDGLAMRGAAWAFLRYAADRRGGNEESFWKSLVGSDQAGLDNVRAAIGGAEPLLWLRDWVAAVYLDDAVAGIAAEYQQPSWNFRSIYPALTSADGQALGRYPLRTIAPTPGTAEAVEIRAGSGAHLRFEVAPATRGEVRASTGGATGAACLTGGPAVALGVGQAYTRSGSEALSVCLEGGAGGAEFVWIPFYASSTAAARLALSVTAQGTRAPASAPRAARVPSGPLTLAMSGARAPLTAEPQPGVAWEAAFRAATMRELSRLAPSRMAHVEHSAALEAAEPVDLLHVTVVRTK